jgi:hypothetical protein
VSISGIISYTYKMHIVPINKPILSSVLFINSVYILVIINTLLFFKLAIYFSNILLMHLWPIKQ